MLYNYRVQTTVLSILSSRHWLLFVSEKLSSNKSYYLQALLPADHINSLLLQKFILNNDLHYKGWYWMCTLKLHRLRKTYTVVTNLQAWGSVGTVVVERYWSYTSGGYEIPGKNYYNSLSGWHLVILGYKKKLKC